MVSAENLKRLSSRNGTPPATVLVDGEVRASWKVLRGKRGAVMEVTPFAPFEGADRDEAVSEGLRLLAFLTPDRGWHEIRFAPSG